MIVFYFPQNYHHAMHQRCLEDFRAALVLEVGASEGWTHWLYGIHRI